MTLREKLFSFDGRLRRRDWWLCSIFASLAYVALAALAAAATSGFVHNSSYFLTASIGDPPLQLLCAAAVYAPFVFIQTALSAKRAHDRNKGAALVILLVVATAIMGFLPDLDSFAASGRTVDEGGFQEWSWVTAGVPKSIASIYLTVVLGFLDGTPGPNRFGPSPKGLSGGAPAFMAPGGIE